MAAQSHTVMGLATLVFAFILLPPTTLSQAPIAIDPERAQLLKDALVWMTFRKNGQLATSAELGNLFLHKLKMQYTTSKFYRTFVIAFQHGVLPRLTLQEGQTCDPAYTLEYKNPFNYSVTWYYQKEFTFNKLYNSQDPTALPFCDYRQGLVCNYNTKKCSCPDGAEMTPVKVGGTVQRCQLKEGEICALIDLDHGNDPKHPLLMKHIHQLIFNLERPPSCQPGTQCRFKKGKSNFYPSCFSSGPWNDQLQDPDFGDECAIGLWASPGSCKAQKEREFSPVTYFEGFTCYNYGPPRNQGMNGPGVVMRTGFCGPDYGPYGISRGVFRYDYGTKEFDPLFFPFIHPRTVPYRGAEFKRFVRDNLDSIHLAYFLYGDEYHRQSENAGEPCNMDKTAKMEQAWTFFKSLDSPPPPGQEFVATKAEIQKNMNIVIKATEQSSHSKFCQVYTYQAHDNNWTHPRPSLKCVTTGAAPDSKGNDGKCEKPGNVNLQAFDKRYVNFLRAAGDAEKNLMNQEEDCEEYILYIYPDPECDPQKGPIPRLLSRANHPEPREGLYCPDGSVCYEDYGARDVLQNADCRLNTGTRLKFACHKVDQPLQNCEKKYVDKLVQETITNLDSYAKLGEGEACDFQLEKVLRDQDQGAIEQMHPYEILSKVRTRGQLCSEAGPRKLECTTGGTCECVGDSCTDIGGGPVTEPPIGPGVQLQPAIPYGAATEVGMNHDKGLLLLIILAGLVLGWQ